jgi:2-amino-4-hydroxy-6-hydroxymethyldihydropteridine diphosphokinase
MTNRPSTDAHGRPPAARCLLLLGSNLGDRRAWLRQARELLAQRAGTIVGQSSLYESEPWGFVSPDRFLNQAVAIATTQTPEALLATTQQIETLLGRQPATGRRYASRTMDIDLLFYENRQIESAALTLPHPRLHERRFTLLPLAEIAPDWVHPRLKKTVTELLEACSDEGSVNLTKN